jgi:hypothetical protein
VSSIHTALLKLCRTNTLTVWAFYPETKGLTLEEIDTLFIKDHEVTQILTEKGQSVRVLEEKGVSFGEISDLEKR